MWSWHYCSLMTAVQTRFVSVLLLCSSSVCYRGTLLSCHAPLPSPMHYSTLSEPSRQLFVGLWCCVFGRGLITVILAEESNCSIKHSAQELQSQRHTLTADCRCLALVPPSPPGLCLRLLSLCVRGMPLVIKCGPERWRERLQNQSVWVEWLLQTLTSTVSECLTDLCRWFRS